MAKKKNKFTKPAFPSNTPMGKPNDKNKWYKYLKILIAVLGVLVAYAGYQYCKAQFEVSIAPLEIKVAQGGRGETVASIKNSSLINWKYKKPVNLEAQSELKDMKFTFSPDAPTLPDYDCKVTLAVNNNAPLGKYKTTLIGTGENGESQKADFFITVIASPCPSPYVKEVEQYFAPSGWMCNRADIRLDTRCTEAPYLGNTCIKIDYSAQTDTPCQTDGWIGAGIYWFCNGCNFGANKPDPEIYNFSCAKSLVFMAKGAIGGERAEFKVGGVKGQFSDGINPARTTGMLVLTNKWTLYRIDFTEGDDLTTMISGFCWVTDRDWNPKGCTIYVDDIKFVDR
jgi:hypothetical protein